MIWILLAVYAALCLGFAFGMLTAAFFRDHNDSAWDGAGPPPQEQRPTQRAGYNALPTYPRPAPPPSPPRRL
ncbi:hypothetical protein [Marilutibacter alkalisoli]|uniref:Uncharacterized protein n=1 Tax=Marilutibacter alkalisoli TaxID=2591633 RepID=A0A514BTZ4_9GAMM|nr:hypothetical protein [Lysobacter alkalisoli]QDH70873.1 hypothetical protein FKV23_12845 [Lysobacter alkalisoli]